MVRSTDTKLPQKLERCVLWEVFEYCIGVDTHGHFWVAKKGVLSAVVISWEVRVEFSRLRCLQRFWFLSLQSHHQGPSTHFIFWFTDFVELWYSRPNIVMHGLCDHVGTTVAIMREVGWKKWNQRTNSGGMYCRDVCTIGAIAMIVLHECLISLFLLLYCMGNLEQSCHKHMVQVHTGCSSTHLCQKHTQTYIVNQNARVEIYVSCNRWQRSLLTTS